MGVNLVAVVITGLIGYAVAALWYSKAVFGKTWMKYSGMTKKKIDNEKKKGMGGRYFTSFLTYVLIALVIGIFIQFYPRTVPYGLLTGFLMWVGFVLTTSVTNVLWEEGKHELWVLHNGQYLLSFLVMGLILGIWI